ncbi:Uncharacterised protein [Mycobacteroides abscessus subsp. abscessus]|nr:Uncharacterised protein [Mycobacteroides abscessus subsp. abscessus]
MDGAYFKDGQHWNCQYKAGNTGDFPACQQGKHNKEWMHMQALAYNQMIIFTDMVEAISTAGTAPMIGPK